MILYFFYLYGGHQNLHSFPTRRSSDLRHTDPPAAQPQPHRAENRLNGFRRRAKPVGDLLREFVRLLLAAETRDRKSTRLNSSHAHISYAVFCLKKKA